MPFVESDKEDSDASGEGNDEDNEKHARLGRWYDSQRQFWRKKTRASKRNVRSVKSANIIDDDDDDDDEEDSEVSTSDEGDDVDRA